MSGGPRRKQQGTCGNHRSMGLCNSGHRAQRHRSEKDREVWYGTLCHHGMVDFGCVQGHHPCSAGTGILAASHRRHQLYRRFGILRLEERKIPCTASGIYLSWRAACSIICAFPSTFCLWLINSSNKMTYRRAPVSYEYYTGIRCKTAYPKGVCRLSFSGEMP